MSNSNKDPKVAKEQFVQAIRDRYRELGGNDLQLIYQIEDDTIIFPGGEKYKENHFNLNNTFHEFLLGDESQREELVTRILMSIMKMSSEEDLTREETLAFVLPCLRERFYFESCELWLRLKGIRLPEAIVEPVPHRRLTEHFIAHLVVLSKGLIKTLAAHDFKELDIDFDQAFEVAMKNLEYFINKELVEDRPGLFVGRWSDDHAPARLLLPNFVNAIPVKGYPVVAAANRNLILITGSEDTENHSRFIELICRAYEEPRPMSPYLLINRGAGWEEWIPTSDTPYYLRFQELRIAAIGQDYLDQKEILEKIYEKEGTALTVGSFNSAIGSDTKSQFSFCIWAKNERILLPKTNRIIFFDPVLPRGQDIVCEAGWDAVMDRLGSVIKPQGMFPERYLIESFPSLALLEELDLRRSGDSSY